MQPVWYIVRFTSSDNPLIHVLWRTAHANTLTFGCGTDGSLFPCPTKRVITCVACMAKWLALNIRPSRLPIHVHGAL